MRLLEEAKTILESYGYLSTLLREDMLQFEDDTLLGFVCEWPLRTILDSWSLTQDQFLKANAGPLRRSALKAWNLYSVFLTADVASDLDRKRVVSIADDFRATRKIVQTGITTRSEVIHALYPFIPIQNIAPLEIADPVRKLRARLSGLPQRALDALLDERVDEQSLLKVFQEAHENQAG